MSIFFPLSKIIFSLSKLSEFCRSFIIIPSLAVKKPLSLISNFLKMMCKFSLFKIISPFIAFKRFKLLLYLYFSALISKLFSSENIFPLFAFIKLPFSLTDIFETSNKYLSAFKILKLKKKSKKNMINLFFIYSH